ncbi:MAG: hypothetical protein BVN33_11465 [Proteobacteria bacterium ST_bin13]|nr:MAG: hypothetical protein BVN33_11465 [Proteobacteria bacterium ST_bin13]
MRSAGRAGSDRADRCLTKARALTEEAMMTIWQVVVVVGLFLHPSVALAQSVPVATASAAPTKPHLQGLTEEEAATLVRKLEDAQRRMTANAFVSFDLLAGSMASNAATKISPRKAFLDLPFQKVWSLTRIPTDNRLWQPFRLTYFPEGLGKWYWEIEVVLENDRNIQRVTLLYKFPAPF